MPFKKIPGGDQFLIKILKKYKRNPCLWDSTHKDYHSKAIKEAAWDKILQTWKKLDPDAKQSDVKSKIFHMRTNYTRQRKKVENNTGKPTLWYYKYLSFLSGSMNQTDSEDESDSDVDDLLVYHRRGQKRPASTSIDHLNNETCLATEDPSADAFGRSVAAQLQHLSKMQRCIAEKLISDVIYHGKLEQLTTGALIKLKDHVSAEDIVIPPSEPSWYEKEGENKDTTDPSSRCAFVVGAESPLHIDETENAVNFIRVEPKVENKDTTDPSSGCTFVIGAESPLHTDETENAVNFIRVEPKVENKVTTDPSSGCTFVIDAESPLHDETENAVNFIKAESDESEFYNNEQNMAL